MIHCKSAFHWIRCSSQSISKFAFLHFAFALIFMFMLRSSRRFLILDLCLIHGENKKRTHNENDLTIAAVIRDPGVFR